MKLDYKTKAGFQKKARSTGNRTTASKILKSWKKDYENDNLERSSMEITASFKQNIDKTGTAGSLSPAPSQYSRLKKAFTIPIYIWYPIFEETVMRLSSTSFYPASR